MASILVLFMVAFGLFVAVTVAAAAAHGPAMRTRHHRGPADPLGPRVPLAPERGVSEGMDPALAELRLRYARGEVGREEFLQRKIDLE